MTRTVRGVIAFALALASTGCEFNKTILPPPSPTVVVHAVLNPDATSAVILVEETLTGRVTINDSLALTPSDPIVTAGGQPITGATVFLERADGSASVRATETQVLAASGPRGTGRYDVLASTLPIVSGKRYRLRITTIDGRVVSGETTVPGPVTGVAGGAGSQLTTVRIDRSIDTLRLAWGATPGGRAFAIRVDTPNGAWFLFSDSTRFNLAGTLRNFFAPGIPSVFYPGFSQRVSVTAVDSNFYDYYRSGNDPFGGTGLINKLQGGIGLFGSVAPALARSVSVGQSARLPLDGQWLEAGINDSLDLWIETSDPKISTISGRDRPNGQSVLGTLRGADVRLAFLNPVTLDTVLNFSGKISGDTISGTGNIGPSTSGGTLPGLIGVHRLIRTGAPKNP